MYITNKKIDLLIISFVFIVAPLLNALINHETHKEETKTENVVASDKYNKDANEEQLNGRDVTDHVKEDSKVEDEESLHLKYPKIAKVPNQNIYLLDDKNGVILQTEKGKQLFNWNWKTPQLIHPTIQSLDLDNDGINELAIVIHAGSGTGININELHILKLIDTKKYADYLFNDFKKINDRIKITYEPNDLKLTVNVDNTPTIFILDDIKINGTVKVAYPTPQIVQFMYVNQQLTLKTSVVLEAENPFFINYTRINIYAKILFKNGKFSLENIEVYHQKN